MDQTNSITVDGISYDAGQFTQSVQQAVSIYKNFQADLQKEQLAVIKTQAALDNIGKQIGEAVKTELAEKLANASKVETGSAA